MRHHGAVEPVILGPAVCTLSEPDGRVDSTPVHGGHLAQRVETHRLGHVLDVAVDGLHPGALHQNVRLPLDVAPAAAHQEPPCNDGE